MMLFMAEASCSLQVFTYLLSVWGQYRWDMVPLRVVKVSRPYS